MFSAKCWMNEQQEPKGKKDCSIKDNCKTLEFGFYCLHFFKVKYCIIVNILILYVY